MAAPSLAESLSTSLGEELRMPITLAMIIS